MITSTIKSLLFLLLCRASSGYVLQDSAEPLFLTPYINNGQLEEGREAAKVAPLLDNVKSYSGLLTVDENLDKNLFFWYFSAENRVTELSYFNYTTLECISIVNGDPLCMEMHYSNIVEKDNTPVILWLQGGPGVTSMFGLLMENGPYELQLDDLSLKLREHRWSKSFHLLYIDSPVGTGFSFAKEGVYDQNEKEVSEDLYEALLQFFKLFPNLADNDFIIAGESYAGRYVPALGLRIHQENPTASQKINLAGLMIGDGMVDDEFMVYGDYLAQHGLIDLQDLPKWQNIEKKYKDALIEKDYETANTYSEEFLGGILETGVSPYNFLETKDFDLNRLSQFFNSEVRQEIHVGNLPFIAENQPLYDQLWKGDFFMKVSTYTEELLETYRVMHYNGQLDIICHYPMAEEYTNNLQWSGSNEFRTAQKNEWMVEQKLAGYIQSGGNLHLVMVRVAGHMVPHDQPKWAFDLVTKFVNNEL